MMGWTIGTSNDGKVFLKQPYLGNVGEPLETTLIWSAKVAKEIGECLVGAAEAAAAQEAVKDADNDSTRTNRGSP